MDAVAKGNMAWVRAVDIEDVRVIIFGRIPVGGGDHQKHELIFLNGSAMKIHVLFRESRQHLYWRLIAQHFFYGIRR